MTTAVFPGKSSRLVSILWMMQIYQLLLVFLSPSVFASASYIGIKDSARIWPEGFGWATTNLYHSEWKSFSYADLWIAMYFFIYMCWTFYSHFLGKAKISEALCVLMAHISFVFIFPVYFAVWYSIFTNRINFVDGLVVASIGFPVIIALAQSATSAFCMCSTSLGFCT